MDTLFNEILISTGTDLTVLQSITAMLMSMIFGCIIAYTYYKTQTEDSYQKSLAVTLCMLPVILTVIILFVGSNVARAFSLAGTLSIIRFRSAPGDAKDIGFIFFDIAAGLACGVGLYGYGAMFVILLCVFLIILSKTTFFEPKTVRKTLKILIPEDLNYQSAFDDILDKYTTRHTLSKIETVDLGSLFQLVYTVSMKDNLSEREFINELRCRNGNLSIVLSLAPVTAK